MSLELWRYCKAMATTPRQALRDPDLPFNLSIMRAADAAREFKKSMKIATLNAENNPFGVARLIVELQALSEDH